VQSAIESSPLWISVVAATLAGMLGFFSPCTIPLVPGYLGYVTGSPGNPDGGTSARRSVAGAALFVAGFSSLLIAQGLLFGSLGSTIGRHHDAMQRWLGVVVVLLGFAFIGLIRPAQREFKIHRLPRAGLLGAPIVGFTFALAWTPCLTPTFGAVLTQATQQGTASRGAVLMAAYCVGLGLPFITIACGFGWAAKVVTFIRLRQRALVLLGGVALIVMGSAMALGVWESWIFTLRSYVAGLGTPPLP